MKTKKNDFIEIDFTASIKDGEVFDTTSREEALKEKLIDEKDKREFKPLALCIGQEMVVKGLDKELEDKEESKDYSVEIKPQDAFGARDPRRMRVFPLNVFKEMPVPGVLVNVDGIVAKILSVAGGRAVLDFNSPLAGKNIVYKFRINKIIEEKEKKIEIIAGMFGLKLESVKIEAGKAVIGFEKKEKIPGEIFREFGRKTKELAGIELAE